MVDSAQTPDAPHIPVLLRPLLRLVAPVSGTWLDGTFGAGGYARGLLAEGADRVIGVDQDPLALEMAESWIGDFQGRLELRQGNFANLDDIAGEPLDGIVLDLGVSSMQLDLAERGFSFMKDGPLDMRMSQAGPSAADLVNGMDEGDLADVIFLYGEERASRRIARAIVRNRAEAPIEGTLRLANIVEGCLPRAKPGQSHPATRTFQALRIAVNDEYGALAEGLMAAERALKPGGQLAVVTFHSVEDRMVKRFIQMRSGGGGRANRYAPEMPEDAPRFTPVTKKAVGPDDDELAVNPRARSARLRIARRTEAPAEAIDRKALGMPVFQGKLP
ncbi:16S rRNA (cytosine(1402)-N(4))-methyltransferase RsmH [Pseudooceanicola onchidii]|uniref:16S rRNA (cytosine(1402)-N(4))-methyltransferase RsmH n=1 Tax=Pseudooceanicola onchidii TaxID=2562279 RepID=UPI0010AA7ADB|nr:16S rRNA (cytosine(1402)-N(4))-methyltransferase RsmH [Pseudooceanicola onchidii]